MAIDWRSLAIAETHPLRVELLELIDASEEPLPPIMLSKLVREPLGNVSFHVGRLRDAGLIVLAGTRPRRGAVEHLYSMTGGEA